MSEQRKENLPLFDYQASRNTDPISSHIAEEKITRSGVRGKQAMRVYGVLLEHNGSTSKELSQYLGGDRYMASRRLPDLEKAGMVVRGEMRTCTVCNQKCVTWEIVNG